MRTKTFGNRPIMQILQLHDNLDCSKVGIPEGASAEDLSDIWRAYAHKMAYITWLTHGGALGSYGLMDYINDLPGM